MEIPKRKINKINPLLEKRFPILYIVKTSLDCVKVSLISFLRQTNFSISYLHIVVSQEDEEVVKWINEIMKYSYVNDNCYIDEKKSRWGSLKTLKHYLSVHRGKTIIGKASSEIYVKPKNWNSIFVHQCKKSGIDLCALLDYNDRQPPKVSILSTRVRFGAVNNIAEATCILMVSNIMRKKLLKWKINQVDDQSDNEWIKFQKSIKSGKNIGYVVSMDTYNLVKGPSLKKTDKALMNKVIRERLVEAGSYFSNMKKQKSNFAKYKNYPFLSKFPASDKLFFYSGNVVDGIEYHPEKLGDVYFSIVVCATDISWLTNFLVSIDNEEGRKHFEVIVINNRRGIFTIPEALNKGWEMAHGEWVIFAHQDIEVCENFVVDLKNILKGVSTKSCGVIGNAGIVKMNAPKSNIILNNKIHKAPKKKKIVQVDILDELILIVRNELKEKLRFDETLSRYHFYGPDLCLQARMKRKKNFVINLPIKHYSCTCTSFSNNHVKEYKRSAINFWNKWKKRYTKIVTTTAVFDKKHHLINSWIPKVGNIRAK